MATVAPAGTARCRRRFSSWNLTSALMPTPMPMMPKASESSSAAMRAVWRAGRGMAGFGCDCGAAGGLGGAWGCVQGAERDVREERTEYLLGRTGSANRRAPGGTAAIRSGPCWGSPWPPPLRGVRAHATASNGAPQRRHLTGLEPRRAPLALFRAQPPQSGDRGDHAPARIRPSADCCPLGAPPQRASPTVTRV